MRKSKTTSRLFDETIERLLKISKEKPLIPESFIPWNMDLEDRFEFIPESLLSLYGDILYDKLTKNQKRGVL
jgi:hypothetical protein